MKRTMRWMWEYETLGTDEKGKPLKGTAMSLTPVENSRRIRVAHYGENKED